jgi:transcriptional regulator with XRE-family HTH domain
MAQRAPRYNRWTYLDTLMTRKRWEEQDLAAAAGCSTGHIYRLLQGRTRGSRPLLYKLAEIFEVDPAELKHSQPHNPPRDATRRPKPREAEVA